MEERAWRIWVVPEGFCAEVQFHSRPLGGSVGKGDSSRRRICRWPGPEKREGGLVLEPESLRGAGDEVRKHERPFFFFI